MITVTPSGAATANLQVALAPAASGPVELRAGSGDDGRLGDFPRALQRTVDEPAPAPARAARAVAARPARREGAGDVSVVAPVAAGDDAGTLLKELNARHALRTKIASEGLSSTPSADGPEARVVASRPPKPAPGGLALPPADGDGAVSTPPLHDRRGAPLPRDTAAQAGPAPVAPRSALTSATAFLHGLSATMPAATGTLPQGGPQPAVPRPRSDAGQGALQPLPAAGDLVAPPADGEAAGSTPPFHDRPGVPMPRDGAVLAGPAPASPRSASTYATVPLHGLSSTMPAATGTPPPGGPQPAVPRPRSDVGKGLLQPLAAPSDVVAPLEDDDGTVSTPPLHDRPVAPLPRDSGTEAAPAVAAPAETRAPDLGAGLDTAPRFSPGGETLGAGGHRTATEPTAGQQAVGQPVPAVAPDAAHTAAQAAPWPGPVQATVAGIVAPQVLAADDDFARPANETGSTAFVPSLPMGQPLVPAGLSALAATGTPAEARLPAAPGSADFSSQLGAQLTTFVREGVQHARLHLHPAELGPVTVRIQIDGQAAQVHLAAEHALTRQALEQSMPMLAGSLREAGLTLSGGGVFEQPRQRDGGDAPGQPGAGPGNAPGGDRGPETTRRSPSVAPARRGVVDLVA